MVERKKPVSSISRMIGKNMQRIIKETGNTVDSGAKLMGIPVRSRFGHYLNQYVEIPVEVVFKFHQVFNVSLDELFGIREINLSATTNTSMIYIILETLVSCLNNTGQRLTPTGFTKVLSLLHADYAPSANYEEVVIDTLKKAKAFSPELFIP